ncbi:MAG: 50S ribosomal protein L3 [Candidatus Acidiferrales bacterium]|nr:50S ribosomal protein L3 [Acidobacteriota bacterium]MCH7765210.1 50S ribosomal protein L3 [Acidobacteriota bacterium]MCH7985774.1 50S ribosomal protein L3 [Acidobacteriota bacterium]MCH8946370.1 50S ribosomal protein L3 [Acidobacteriota bacterium]
MAVKGILGKKLGMTQLFADDGRVIPVTVLKAGPCVVVQRKTTENDGYEAVQLGLVEFVKPQRVNKPRGGHFKKHNVPPVRLLREFRLADGKDEVKAGDKVLVEEVFKPEDRVDVIGVSKGRGWAGVVRRYHFRGGNASHGSMFHRAPGSIGASSYPSRVWPGQRMAGQMGNKRATVRSLRVVKVDAEEHLLLVRGAVPGANGGYVLIQASTKLGKRRK